MTLADELDSGITGNANVYNSLLKNIYDRVDRIYGTTNIDILEGMKRMIDENAEKRSARGWG